MANEQSVEQFKGKPRLPKFAVPRRYEIFLKPDLAACKFAGAVEITVDVVGATRFLVLNAADLEVANGSVWFKHSGSAEVLRPLEIVAVVEDEILVIEFGDYIDLGEGVLGIEFHGALNDQMKGFYRRPHSR